MKDLRTWQDDPVGMVEWLLDGAWEPYCGAGATLRCDAGHVVVVGLPGGVIGWAFDLAGEVLGSDPDDHPKKHMGPETGDAGIRVASLAILASRPVWRMPSGGDVILGRYPTTDEIVRHPGGEGLDNVWLAGIGVERRPIWMTSDDMEVREEAGMSAPLYAIPLRADGLPGEFKGGV